MLSRRKSGFPWLLLLMLVCSLLGRPLHEAWHIVHLSSEKSSGMSSATGAGIEMSVADVLVAAEGGNGDGIAGSDEGGGDGEGGIGVKADACAWCLFHAQAAPAAHVPQFLLTHAEASPPPAALPSGWIPARHWGVAEPRGPPSA